MYADDLLVISDSNFKMQSIFKIIEQYCNRMEIKINGNKTQYIQIGPKSKTCKTKLKLSGEEIDEVSKFKYLGVWIRLN